MSSLAARVRSSQRYNIETLKRQPLVEISGSLGDMGTLLPLLIALTLTRSIDLSSTLVFTGLANIFSGLIFSIPLPVQPMKAIAAVAIARKFTVQETTGAGLFVSAVIGLLSITGLLNWIGRVVPIPVVKGIQVGAGLSLVISAGSTLLQPRGWLPQTKPWDSWWLAAIAFVILLVTTVLATSGRRVKIPYALLVFAVGLVIAGATYSQDPTPNFFAIWRPQLISPSWSAFVTGAVDAGLGQLPLTTLNSIIAVTHLSAELLPQRPVPSSTSVGLSILVMNGIGCAFGAMPACHGSGGLAAQFRFGARSGSSVVILGMFKLLLGLAVNGDWLVGILEQFPKSLLGIMVIAAGVELAKVGESLNKGARDLWEEAAEEPAGMKPRSLDEQERGERWMVMMVTVAGLLAFKNDAVGFIAGWLWHFGLQAPNLFTRTRASRSEESQSLLHVDERA